MTKTSWFVLKKINLACLDLKSDPKEVNQIRADPIFTFYGRGVYYYCISKKMNEMKTQKTIAENIYQIIVTVYVRLLNKYITNTYLFTKCLYVDRYHRYYIYCTRSNLSSSVMFFHGRPTVPQVTILGTNPRWHNFWP
jgi:hypothetical protein